MSNKWVDNESYIGPDRRSRGLGKRWGDRRQLDDAGDPPPLGAVLRRLRVLLFDPATPEDRRNTQELIGLAILEAEQLGLKPCADALREAQRLFSFGDFPGADARVVEAMSFL
jgi:hypothetical protein